MPLHFVSAADGTNVVKIFKEALEKGLHYKLNPPKDDFMTDVMDLLNDVRLQRLNGRRDFSPGMTKRMSFELFVKLQFRRAIQAWSDKRVVNNYTT